MAKAINRGDVVLTKFPFTDLEGTSVRPALVVSQGSIGQDVVLSAISTTVRGPLALLIALLTFHIRNLR